MSGSENRRDALPPDGNPATSAIPEDAAQEPAGDGTARTGEENREVPRTPADGNGTASPSGTGPEAPDEAASADAGENLPAPAGENLPAESASEDGEGGDEEDGEGGRMSLMDHLRELRHRLLYALAAVFVGFLACWAVVEPIFNVLTTPMLEVLPAGSSAMYTTLPEAFFTRLYIAFMAGIFLASPFIFYQIWAFISPGLYKEEKRFILPLAAVSAVFFLAGGLFCYFVVFHFAFSFFVSYASKEIVAMPKISEYLDFVLKLLLAFGFTFEMPIFSFFLSRMGIVTADRMRSFRRYAVLAIFILAAILTPPDVVSQLLMALPMLILYEVSILVAAAFGRKPEPAAPEDGDGDAGGEDAEEGGEAGEEKTGEEAPWVRPEPAQATESAQATETGRPEESAPGGGESPAEKAGPEPAETPSSGPGWWQDITFRDSDESSEAQDGAPAGTQAESPSGDGKPGSARAPGSAPRARGRRRALLRRRKTRS